MAPEKGVKGILALKGECHRTGGIDIAREFKLEALRLAVLGERPKAQIARELGIRVNQLR